MAGTSGSPAAKGVPLQEDADTGASGPGMPVPGPGAPGAAPAAPVTSGIGLRLSGVARNFGPLVAVSGVDLEVPLQSRLSIVGPSGCGKSTLLALICGLDEPNEGTIDGLGATTSADRPGRGAGPGEPGCPAAHCPAAGRAPGRAVRAGRVRGAATVPAVRRHAAAGVL